MIGFAMPKAMWQNSPSAPPSKTKPATAVLTSFSVANFKAFGPIPPQRVELKPITLVFGANSAGKSSLLHSLALAKNAHENGEFDVRPGNPITGDSVDLGGFRQFVHGGGESKGPVTLGFSFTVPGKTGRDGAAINGFRKLYSRCLSTSSNFTVSVSIDAGGPNPTPHVGKLTLEVDGQPLLRMASVPLPRSNASLQRVMRIESWETEHPVSLHMISECLDVMHGNRTDEEIAFFREEVEVILGKVTLSAENTLFPHELVDRRGQSVDRTPGERDAMGNDSESQVRRNVQDNFERQLGPLLKDIHNLLTVSLGGLVYLGPLRDMPERHLIAEKMDGRNVSGGSSALKRVINDSDLRARINQCLTKLNTGYEIRVQATLGEEDIRSWVERSVKFSLRSIIEDAARTPRVQEEIDSIRESLPDDLAAYVKSNPDLHSQLAENWWYAQRAWREEEEGEEEVEAYTMEDAMDHVLDNVTGTHPLYFEEILDHYLENSDEFTPLVDRYFSRSSVEKFIDNITENRERRELSLYEKTSGKILSLRDIGVGISQLLPALVHAYAEEGKLIAIEQPEIHVHPKLQAEIADVFIESALGGQGNSFLLETHSEHLILRIMRRIRETARKQLPADATPVRPEDVQVIYVDIDPATKRTYARELRIDSQGRFIDNWPNGFFEERLQELF